MSMKSVWEYLDNNEVDKSTKVIMSFAVSVIYGIIFWPYVFNTWLVFFGCAPQIVWWQGMLFGIYRYTRTLSLHAAILTWVIMLFLK